MKDARLFHFSDDGSITRFEPRPVRVPATRAPGEERLNGPLVWAVDEEHQAPYLFPRDVPRIVLWALPSTTADDRARWLGDADTVAYVEPSGRAAMNGAVLYRYELPVLTFTPTSDEWMWVSRDSVVPLATTALTNLPEELRVRGVDLRVSDELSCLREVWHSSLHASGIRLRNAQLWTTE